MPRLSERTRQLATQQRDAALEALRLRDQQRELRAEVAALDAEQGRVRTELAEARVCRALEREPATMKLADERIVELGGALADMASRATTLREALIRVGNFHAACVDEEVIDLADARAVAAHDSPAAHVCFIRGDFVVARLRQPLQAVLVILAFRHSLAPFDEAF
jgi:predicted RNase H-like nuclease (RuvC/YqgF family)